MKKPALLLATVSASALVLAGCAPAADDTGAAAAEDGKIVVAASTNVYGSLAAEIGGDRVDVTSIITSSTQDPHSYEASARDRLAVEEADLVIENGGGYDSFMQDLREGSDVPVVTAVEFADGYPGDSDHDHDHDDAESEDEHADEADDHDHDDAEGAHADEEHAEGEDHDHAEDEHADEEGHEGHNHIEGFNEHVWFDPHTMIHLAEDIAEELTELDAAGADEFAANAEAVIAELEGFEDELTSLQSEVGGQGVFITEPVPGYLALAAGLTDRAPEGFAASVEEGRDVAPATLLAAVEVIEKGEVRAVLANAQTGGAETQRIEDAAKAAGIPVVAFQEILPEGTSYAEWMRDAIQSLADALAE